MTLLPFDLSSSALQWGGACLLAGALFTSLGCAHGSTSQAADPTPERPVELGAVDWERDYERAVARSKKSGKPIFLLFQEVPG